MGDQPCRKAATYTGQHKQEKRGQASMHRVGFELTNLMIHRAKTFPALDRAATVIGSFPYNSMLCTRILAIIHNS
jgi:hypothetical protein